MSGTLAIGSVPITHQIFGWLSKWGTTARLGRLLVVGTRIERRVRVILIVIVKLAHVQLY
jgi:hypothetical protein